MYSRDKLFTRSLECYFGVYFPRCCTTREINTKITPSWAHKQFAIPVHKLFSMSALLSECIIATWHGTLSVLMVSSLHKGRVMRRFAVLFVVGLHRCIVEVQLWINNFVSSYPYRLRLRLIRISERGPRNTFPHYGCMSYRITACRHSRIFIHALHKLNNHTYISINIGCSLEMTSEHLLTHNAPIIYFMILPW